MYSNDELDQLIDKLLANLEESDQDRSPEYIGQRIPDLSETIVLLREMAVPPSSQNRNRVWSIVSEATSGQSIENVTGTSTSQLWRRLAKVAAVILAVLTVSGVTVGVAAAHSLPDSGLYPVKLALEQAQMGMTNDPALRASLELRFAETRLEEVLALEKAGKGINSDALELMSSSIDRASSATIDIEDPLKEKVLNKEVTEAISHQQEVLQSLLEKVPDSAADGLKRAIQATQQTQEKVPELDNAVQNDKPKVDSEGVGPNNNSDGEQERKSTPPGQEDNKSGKEKDKKSK